MLFKGMKLAMKSFFRINLITLVIFVTLFIPLPFASSRPNDQGTTILRAGMLIQQGTNADMGARLAANELNSDPNFTSPTGQLYQIELVYPPIFPANPEEIPGAVEALKQQGIH